MASLSNVGSILRERGAGVLAGAVWNLTRGNLRRLLGQRFIERQVHDYRMLLDMHDRGISRSLLLFGTREVEHKIILERVLKPGMTVFVIGAYFGYYALMDLGLIGSSGKLVAIEPSPTNVALLKRNLSLNGHKSVPVIETAISDKPGERLFHLSRQSNLGTFHDTGSGVRHLSGESIPVRTMTVPEIAAQHGAPDLIRMDVEGHEVEVIGGMLEHIRKRKLAPMILFETHLSRYSPEHDMAAILKALFDNGYTTRYLASSWERGTKIIEARGYKGSAPIATDGVQRVIFENISDADAIDFICKTGGARTVLLAPGKA
ncbi:MAG: FkbM family methyltransferase [Pseudomonadota bacterium]|nr:FkbM family methyltransferase [Pseudomonadota bacterium]